MQLQHFKVHELVVPTMKDREITYKWKSKTADLETLEHTGEPVGVMVLLEIEVYWLMASSQHHASHDRPGASCQVSYKAFETTP